MSAASGRRLRRALGAGAISLFLTRTLVGCASETYDSRLWLRIDAQQVGMSQGFAELMGKPLFDAGSVNPNASAQWLSWDGTLPVVLDGPEVHDPSNPVTVFYNVRYEGSRTVFDVLFSSGRFANDSTGSGTLNAVHTCETVRVSVGDGTEHDRYDFDFDRIEPPHCPPQLVDAVSPGSSYFAPAEFDG